jgi:peptidoglycan hydrolase CwlO-like protein
MQAMSSRPLRAVGAVLFLLLPLIQLATVTTSTAYPSKRDVRRAEQRLDAALDDFQSIQARLDEAKAELAAIRARTERLEGEVQRIARRVVQTEEAVIEAARAIYMSGSAGVLEGLLASRSIADLEAGLNYLRSSGQAHSAELERLIVNRKLLEQRLDQLDAERERATEIAADVKRLADTIGSEVTRRRAEVAAVRKERAEYEARVAAAQKAAREIQDQARAVTQSPAASRGPYSVDWDAIAQCESGGNWQLDGEYDGGLQFHPDTWLAYGGGQYARYAWQASRVQQIAIAEKVLAHQGPSAWPNCFEHGR